MGTRMGLRPTVIIPCKNYGQFIGNAIESVLAQDFTEKINIVVVDDASTDNTKEVVSKYDVKYLRREESGGPSSARNWAIRESWSYTDVWFNLDADDFFYPSKVRKFIEVFETKPDIGIVYGDYDILQGDLKRRECKEPYNNLRLRQECIIHSGAAFSKEVFKLMSIKKGDNVYDQTNFPFLCEDWDLWLRMTRYCMGYHVAEPLTCVRIHDDNLSRVTPQNQEAWNKSWAKIGANLSNGIY